MSSPTVPGGTADARPPVGHPFSGVLTGRSFAGLFAQGGGEHPARAEGDIRVTIDRDLRGSSTAQGRFTGQRIQFDRLMGKPLRLEKIDLDGNGNGVRVNEASIAYAEHKATLRGEVRRSSAGLVINAEIDSPGIVLDGLLPETRETAATGMDVLKSIAPEMLVIWPLPVEGKLKVRAGFIEYSCCPLTGCTTSAGKRKDEPAEIQNMHGDTVAGCS